MATLTDIAPDHSQPQPQPPRTGPHVPPGARTMASLPTPRGLPILGNLHQIRPLRLHRTLEQWHTELGGTYKLRLGRREVVVFADAEMLQALLRDRPEGFRRASMIESVFREMGANGVFSVEGEAWRPQRKLVMQALALPRLRGFHPTLTQITERLLRRWQRAAAGGATVEMTDDLMRYTVDVTTALAFGDDPNTLEREGDVIQNHLAQVFPMMMRRVNAPLAWWRIFKLPSDRRFDRSLAAVHTHVQGLIGRARKRLHDSPADAPRNVLEAMLLESTRPDSGLTDADVSANVITLLLAGEDTTANTLAWTMHYLALHPQWQDRLHDEARRVLGEQDVSRRHDDLKQLDAFEACATEATRLRPIVPVLLLETRADVVLGGLHLPRRTMLSALLRPPMLDAGNFGEPHRFRPERWLRAAPGEGHSRASGAACGDAHFSATAGCPAGQHLEAATCAHEPRAYAQFGAGPRVCPGRHLAGNEIRLVLSTLMRHFRIEHTTDPSTIEEVNAFTMMPSRMPMRLVARA